MSHSTVPNRPRFSLKYRGFLTQHFENIGHADSIMKNDYVDHQMVDLITFLCSWWMFSAMMPAPPKNDHLAKAFSFSLLFVSAGIVLRKPTSQKSFNKNMVLMTLPVRMSLTTLKGFTIAVVAIVIWAASVLRHLNVPQFEAWTCQPFRGKSSMWLNPESRR